MRRAEVLTRDTDIERTAPPRRIVGPTARAKCQPLLPRLAVPASFIPSLQGPGQGWPRRQTPPEQSLHA